MLRKVLLRQGWLDTRQQQDINTRLFHMVVDVHRRCNNINNWGVNGVWQSEMNNIILVIQNFIQHLYSNARSMGLLLMD